jgi:plasmid replication initiation protein
MLADVVSDLKSRIAAARKVLAWGALAAAAGLIGLIFLLIALFIWLSERYDTITGCIAFGVIFVLVAALATPAFVAARRRALIRNEASRARASQMTWLLDPAVVASAIDVVRAVGGRRTTMLLVGLLAAGWILNRPSASRTPRPRT